MSEVPANCTACGTAIPAGAERCPGCGKVFGEANRCPHCNAIAAVRKSGAGYVCMACSGPREVREGTVVVGGAAGSAKPTNALAMRAAGGGLRFLGVLGIGAGVLAAAAATMWVPGAIGIALALAFGAAGVGGGALSLRAGAKAQDQALADTRRRRELAILELAEKRGGALTVTEVARDLALSFEEADAALTAMADGSRVSAEVTSEGLVTFVFREIRASAQGPRVRVGDIDDPEVWAEVERVSREADAGSAASGSEPPKR